MEGRRLRGFGRGPNNQTLLPVRASHFSNAISCWYCDFKITVLNEPLFRFGRRHARSLRIWFSVGMGFSLSVLIGVILSLLWELAVALHLLNIDNSFSRLLNGSFFGFNSSIMGAMISLTDVGYIFLSSITSVFIHEVGHALAAARMISQHVAVGATYLWSSEGVQMEYIAVFLAVLFPGAVVAFNCEVLQALPRNSALRIYCAGIWHNAVFCMFCSLLLFVLPLVLKPFYIYGQSPMVLNVSPKSPLAGYLASGDVIISLDGTRVHTVQEWQEKIALLNRQMLQIGSSSHFRSSLGIRGKTGYCIPSSLIRGSIQVHKPWEGNVATCPSDLFPFISVPCIDSRRVDDVTLEDTQFEGTGSIHCLNPQDIIKLKKCGSDNSSSCSCLEDESCFIPVQMPGLVWVEITYSSPPACQKLDFSPENKPYDHGEMNCRSTFTFLGDIISLEHALHLTSYLPRWWSNNLCATLPNALEKLLVCTFHVSLSLALLNSFPVYFLDGECILELMLQCCSLLRVRTRRKVLQWSLVGGTFASVLILFRTFFFIW